MSYTIYSGTNKVENITHLVDACINVMSYVSQYLPLSLNVTNKNFVIGSLHFCKLLQVYHILALLVLFCTGHRLICLERKTINKVVLTSSVYVLNLTKISQAYVYDDCG